MDRAHTTTNTAPDGDGDDSPGMPTRQNTFSLGMTRHNTFGETLRLNMDQLTLRGSFRGTFEALTSTTFRRSNTARSDHHHRHHTDADSASSNDQQQEMQRRSSMGSPTNTATGSPVSGGGGIARNNSFTAHQSFSHWPRWSRHEHNSHEEDDFEMQRQNTVNFAREAVDHYGNLDPMELAMLQAEQQLGNAEDDQEQLTAAEVLANIELLNEKEFAVLTEATHKQMAEGLESALMFNGAAWYLPQITECNEDEEQNSFHFSMQDGEMGLVIAVCGSRVIIPLLSLFLRASFAVLGWFFLWLAFGSKLLEPGGYIFDPVVCFLVCSIVGGILGRVFGVPPLLFVLGMSVMWSNVPTPGALVGGIVKEVRNVIGSAGLTLILIRSGLGMSWKTIKPAAGTILSMSLFPMLAEIVVHGFLASHLIDYGDSSLWPFMQAMTCAPAASAVVGATTLLLRSWGYGTTRGPGVILLPYVSLDMSLGIVGIGFMVSLVFRDPNSSLAWAIGLGPLSIVVGILSGIVLGLLWYGCLLLLFKEARVLPHGRYARAFLRRVARTAAFAMALLGLVAVFVGKALGVYGGGALACVMMAATGSYMITAEGSPEHMHIVKAKMYAKLSSIWDLLIMPALFSISASSIRVTTLFDPAFIGQAVACLFTGVAARLVVTTLCTWSYEMTMSERVISILASAGRATVQVALGPLALSFAEALPDSDIGKADALRYAAHVYDASILGVLIFTPISVILLTRVAPNYWLTDAEHAKLDKEAALKEKLEDGAEASEEGDDAAAAAAADNNTAEGSLGARSAASAGHDHGAEAQPQLGPRRSPQPRRSPISHLAVPGAGGSNNNSRQGSRPISAARRSPLPLDQHGNRRAVSRPRSAGAQQRAPMEGVSTPPAGGASGPPSRGSSSSRPVSRRNSLIRAVGAGLGPIVVVDDRTGAAGAGARSSRPTSRVKRPTLSAPALSALPSDAAYESAQRQHLQDQREQHQQQKKKTNDVFDDWDIPMYESPLSRNQRLRGQHHHDDDAHVGAGIDASPGAETASSGDPESIARVARAMEEHVFVAAVVAASAVAEADSAQRHREDQLAEVAAPKESSPQQTPKVKRRFALSSSDDDADAAAAAGAGHSSKTAIAQRFHHEGQDDEKQQQQQQLPTVKSEASLESFAKVESANEPALGGENDDGDAAQKDNEGERGKRRRGGRNKK